MKVTFTQDHQSTASGNEFYKKGTQADLVKGQTLIDSGVAHAGWGPSVGDAISVTFEPDYIEAAEAVADVYDASGKHIDDYTKAELIDIAREAGIPYAGLTKAQLIEVLTEAE